MATNPKTTKTGITLTDLKKYLKACSQQELEQDIAALFQQVPMVKEFYQIKLNPGAEEEVMAKYAKIVENEFFPTRGFGKARLGTARKAIADYKKICRSAESLISLMVFYVEQGVKFTKEYGDIDEPFYISMEGMFNDAAKLIARENLEDTFRKRCLKIVKDTSPIGWGFHDTLSEIYEDFFGEKG